ncbi:hypothetical protein B5566_02410 [Mycobacterium sp. MHSD3]|nr:hypothetical protein B5566_02410 [Mycobacterium sp. MHSD3]
MANALYEHGREAFLLADIDWENDDIKVAAVDATYTPNLATHQYLSDLTGIVSTTPNLEGKTWMAGVADADNTAFPDVTGSQIRRMVIYQDTGTAGTSRLIECIDTGTGLPITPVGEDIPVAWDNGPNKIFKL